MIQIEISSLLIGIVCGMIILPVILSIIATLFNRDK